MTVRRRRGKQFKLANDTSETTKVCSCQWWKWQGQKAPKFGEQLLIFSQEYRPSGQETRRSVAGKLKPCDLRTISPHLPGPALRTTNLNYRDAVALLVSKVQACKQNKGESVDDFIHRMMT